MSGLGMFQPSTLGMKSQSHKLNTIGYNIANVNTGGFKRIDTEFRTVLSDTTDGNKDYGGVRPFGRATNDVQGLINSTGRPLDLAISGQGFFSIQPELSTDEIYFTRDGSFQINTADGQTTSVTGDDGNTITVANGYLVDKNGMYVRGVAAGTDGTFSATGTAEPMRVDQFAFIEQGQPTTTASLELNLPSSDSFGDTAQSFSLTTYDSNAAARNLSFNFSKSLTDNQWRMDVTADELTTGALSPAAGVSTTTGAGTEFSFDTTGRTISLINSTTATGVPGTFNNLRAGDTITLAGNDAGTNDGTFTISAVLDDGATIRVDETLTGTTNTPTTAVTLASSSTVPDPIIFNQFGGIESPTEMTYTATWSDGATSEITIDLSNMSQFNGEFTPFISSQDGFGNADLTGVSFDSAGHVVGSFSDGTERNIYKIPLFDFTNPNGLASENGLIFQQTTASGEPATFFADNSGQADFVSNAVEISNVVIEQQFTQMIRTQAAYNMSATSFRTVDEMLTVARDLKA
jgi:flagellar hook protein FlgE